MQKTLRTVIPVILGGIVGGAGFAACVLASASHPELTFAAAWTSLCLVGIAGLFLLKRPGVALRLFAGAVITIAPLHFVATSYAQSQNFIVNWLSWCGTGHIGVVMVGPMLSAGAGAVGVLALTALATTRWMQPLSRFGFFGAALMTLTILLTSAADLNKPSAEEWLEAQPVVGTLPPPLDFECHLDDPSECLPRIRSYSFAGRTLERKVSHNGSQLRVMSGDPDAGFYYVQNQHALPQEVRLSSAPDALIIEDTAAFTLDGRPMDLRASDLVGSIRPSLASFALALPCVLLAFLNALQALSFMRRRRSLARARPGVVTAGTIRFSDNKFPEAAISENPVRDGPVVAIASGFTSPPSYRDNSGPPWRVWPGRYHELVRKLEQREATAWLVGVALLLAGAIPLLATL